MLQILGGGQRNRGPGAGNTGCQRSGVIVLIGAGFASILVGIVSAVGVAISGFGYGPVLAALVYLAGFSAIAILTRSERAPSSGLWLVRFLVPLAGALLVLVIALGLGV